ncbi:MAG: hypothetical protein IPH16_15690 [Haliscomenobacter sp.]|nr:hypothetical protein [Haliscomenobacter sp.]
MKTYIFFLVGFALCLSANAQQMEKPLLLPGSVRVLDDQSPIIMPYNRLVASAGTVVEFGNPRLENHALDVAPLPDSRYLAIEDRYGVAILDRTSNAIVSRWTFGAYPRFRTLMSTFSGLKAFEFERQTYLAWGASQRESGGSGIMLLRWASDSLGLAEFIAIARSPLRRSRCPMRWKWLLKMGNATCTSR